MKYKMTYPQFLIFHEFIVDLNFFNFIIMPKSGVGVKSNVAVVLIDEIIIYPKCSDVYWQYEQCLGYDFVNNNYI